MCYVYPPSHAVPLLMIYLHLQFYLLVLLSYGTIHFFPITLRVLVWLFLNPTDGTCLHVLLSFLLELVYKLLKFLSLWKLL